jgi:CBS domain-containing protein
MPVAQLLRHKGKLVRSVDRDATARDAIRAMASYRVGALLVFDLDEAFLEITDLLGCEALHGIVTEREIILGLANYGAAFLSYKVRDIMIADMQFVVPADSIQHAMSLMTHAKVRHLPVIDDSKVVGLISIGDVVKSRLDEKIEEVAVLQDMARVSTALSLG